jgi:hypothetical protein
MMMQSSNFEKIKDRGYETRRDIFTDNIKTGFEDKGLKLKIMDNKGAENASILLFMKIDYYYIRLLANIAYK